MTISTRVKAQLFASTPTNREQLIRLPPTSTKQGGVVVARYAPRLASALSPSVSQKTATAALHNSVATAAAVAAAHQLHAPMLPAHYVDLYRARASDLSALSHHGSSASSTPETSDDEGGWATDSSGRPRVDSAELSPCQQGLACADGADCDNCFFELEILPMLAQMDTTALKDE
ncbi:hypothetical protein PybrP1_011640 [[Pythium] brassicae (nom. inval.)]|nr:hypothetical protein PybrP1_011640 [[Pythium] brassicae (nom. inval.)]